ncbi:coagulation factor 5/8 type domain-containing protein [Clostridium aceticum]|uniref:Coagulation factor 5/8 type domain-containing protein n=1 Tax=Clostridium aceticum TaxID=84022 RepID=A0A0D8I9U8_9CLOT|nr:cadherin-like beta sandwich domain-containing protein [Clostridium aceticum]AKL96034.1 coagulation factor 5/8 type domain-containing protein [Clostridium aceticum]KJF27033.1 hypothetical protein TZ02_09490 [Clostridium aceticum]
MKDQLEAQTNVALYKPAQASSFIKPYIPARAVDGSLNPVNRWLAHTVPNSLDVDLQTPYWIDRWVVKHMGDMGWSSPPYNMSDYEFHVSLDRFNWIKVDSVIGNTLKATDRKFEPVSARYVRVVVRKGLNCNPQLASIGQLEVYQAQPTSAYLNKLGLSSGILKPAFSPANSTYTADVGYTTESITVIPTAEDPNATIKVNGTVVQSGTASQPINLNVGSNTITVEVTSKVGGVVQNYSVNVTRASSAYLNNITISPPMVQLNPAFHKSIFVYTANAMPAIGSVTITPKAEDDNAAITVDGKSTTSGSGISVNLNSGQNVIPIIVSSKIGSDTKTYTITISKP